MTPWTGLSNLRRNEFVRSVGILVGGTALGHTLTAVAMPLVSRLYSPSEFNVLAVISSLLSVISVAACLRFDIAGPIPDEEVDAINLLALAISFALVVSLLLGVAVFLTPSRAFSRFLPTTATPFLWILGPGVFLLAGFNALQSWYIRTREFKRIARSRIGQSVACVGTQVTLGFAHQGPLGLLLGYVMNSGAAVLTLGTLLVRQHRALIRQISMAHMRDMFVLYHRFPKYSTLEALCNNASVQVPIVMIANQATGPEAGYLLLAMSAMQAPMALVGVSIGQVFLSKAPEQYRTGRLGEFTLEVFEGLVKSGVGPLLFAGILSPLAFEMVFGKSWHRAGVLVAWMTPWFVMQFVASPLSMALHVAGRQRSALFLQIFGLVIRVLAVIICARLLPSRISEAYAISGFVIYFTYCVVIFKTVSVTAFDIYVSIKRCVRFVVLWVAGSMGLYLLICFVTKVSR